MTGTSARGYEATHSSSDTNTPASSWGRGRGGRIGQVSLVAVAMTLAVAIFGASFDGFGFAGSRSVTSAIPMSWISAGDISTEVFRRSNAA